MADDISAAVVTLHQPILLPCNQNRGIFRYYFRNPVEGNGSIASRWMNFGYNASVTVVGERIVQTAHPPLRDPDGGNHNYLVGDLLKVRTPIVRAIVAYRGRVFG
jgi:hypothetical protein